MVFGEDVGQDGGESWQRVRGVVSMSSGLLGENIEASGAVRRQRMNGERIESHQPDCCSGHRTDEVMERTQGSIVGPESGGGRNGAEGDRLHRSVDVKRA